MKNSTAINNKRLISLDVFRGFTIIGMIIVNSPGSWKYIYHPLKHAEWNGLTITDLVFPFFLFIVGASIVLSYSKRLLKNISKKKLIYIAAMRAIIIFSLGIILNLISYKFNEIRIMGVLQRIAIAFFACTLLFLYVRPKIQVIYGALILILYWFILYTVPYPGIGIDISIPGKNIAAFIDKILIPGKLYFDTWDPEGILSTLTAIVTTITGMMAGYILISDKNQEQKIILLFVYGMVFTCIGYCWSWFFPFNKSLWTSSYVVFTSGIAFSVYATLFWLIDVSENRNLFTKTGQIFGMNAITAYVLHGILNIPLYAIAIKEQESIQSVFMGSLVSLHFEPELASLIWALLYAGLCFLPIWILYKKNIYIKV